MDANRTKEFRAKIADTARAVLFGSSLLFGDELGLFSAMRGQSEGLTYDELAAKADVDARYTQEWLTHMLSFGVVTYNNSTGKFILPDEHAQVLVDEESPYFATGMLQFGVGCSMIHGKLQHAFKTGSGVSWDQLDERIPNGLRRWFKVNYDHLLVQEWVAKLDPVVVNKLNTGAVVADVGCGHGVSTLRLAKAFPNSQFTGYDYDPDSIRMANNIAEQDNLKNVKFVVAGATDYGHQHSHQHSTTSPQLEQKQEHNTTSSLLEQKHDDDHTSVFDLVCFFAAFHDMSNPEEIVAHTKRILKADGFVFLVEPWAGNSLQETCASPAGALFAGVSMHYCTPCAKTHSHTDTSVMGAVSPNSEYIRLWVTDGGFASLRVVPVENSPNNRVLEVRR